MWFLRSKDLALPTAPLTAMPPLERGRHLTAMLHGAPASELWAHMALPLRRVFKSVKGLERFQREVAEAGTELRLLDEHVTRWIRCDLYSRESVFPRVARVLVQWSLSRDGLADGLAVVPHDSPTPTRFDDYRTRATLRLPFDGEWFVFWGGRQLVDNAHATVAAQRFAYDFVMLRDETTHTGDGRDNADHHCFGQTIVAPASGVVVAAEGDVPDNRPGRMNPRQPLGNHVIIDHGGDEYSLLAHLERGSLRVAVGRSVQPGDPLGRCGNSGNSSAPHLHCHLQNTPRFPDSEGLPAQFSSWRADGVDVARGEPSRGQLVSPRPLR